MIALNFTNIVKKLSKVITKDIEDVLIRVLEIEPSNIHKKLNIKFF